MASYEPTVQTVGGSQAPLNTQDRIILVLGDTGVGKSTFIQALTGQDTGVGETLQSKTALISLYHFTQNDNRVVMVDTPGFDDTQLSDAYVLAALASWLAATYIHGIKLEAVLYLYRISDPRMTGSALRRMQIYQKLLGDTVLSRTIFVSTHWPQQGAQGFVAAEGRAEELATDSRLLERFLRRGAKQMKFLDTPESARLIMEAIPITSASDRPALQIQKELVDRNMGLHKTQAGQIVEEAVQDMVAYYKKMLQERREDAKKLAGAQDERSVADRARAESDIDFYKGLLDRTQKDRKVLVTMLWKKLVRGVLTLFRLYVE